MNQVQRINLDCKIVTEEDMMSHTYLFNAGVKYIETPTNVTSYTCIDPSVSLIYGALILAAIWRTVESGYRVGRKTLVSLLESCMNLRCYTLRWSGSASRFPDITIFDHIHARIIKQKLIFNCWNTNHGA